MRACLLFALLNGCIAEVPGADIDGAVPDMLLRDAQLDESQGEVSDAASDWAQPDTEIDAAIEPDIDARLPEPPWPACVLATPVEFTINAEPGEVVDLNFGQRCDPADIIEFEWVVIESPEGSTSHPYERFFNAQQPANGGEQDDTSTSQAKLFVDIEGTWAVRLFGSSVDGRFLLETIRIRASRS